jgi:hypothetical protein
MREAILEMHRTDCCSLYALSAESRTRNCFANYEYDIGNLILIKSVHITIEVESFADLYNTWRHQQNVVAQLFITEECCSPLRIKKRTCPGYT